MSVARLALSFDGSRLEVVGVAANDQIGWLLLTEPELGFGTAVIRAGAGFGGGSLEQSEATLATITLRAIGGAGTSSQVTWSNNTLVLSAKLSDPADANVLASSTGATVQLQ